MSTRTVICRYNGCGQLFTSKARMKEHVLWHLEVDPPKRIYQHALVRYRTSGGGWVVIQDLGGEEDKGEGSSTGIIPSQAGSEVERFKLTDILPLPTDSQAGNVTTTTTTTTTSGGTISQPISFSPVLPDRPSQISPPSQISQRSFYPRLSYIRSQPTPHSTQSSPMPSLQRSSSREPPTPFVHSAPRSGRARTTASPASPTSGSLGRRISHTGSPSSRRARTSKSPFVPGATGDMLSSTPRLTVEGDLTSQQTQSDSSQYPPASATEPLNPPKPVTAIHHEVGKRTFGFGEALGPMAKTTPVVESGVTYSFGTGR